MRLDTRGVHAALAALGEQLGRAGAGHVSVAVCGGAALQALGLVVRTTRDVDVLAVVEDGEGGAPTLRTAEPLPAALREAARRVGEDQGLTADWLNAGPTGLLAEGLPEGLAGRLHRREYGAALTVYFLDRRDQICFKTYAALNGGDLRHLTDLRALGPTDSEMLAAARWAVTQDAAPFFPDLVRDFLRKVGYPDVAARL